MKLVKPMMLHQLQCYVNSKTTKLKTNEEIYTDNQEHLVD